jgi:hypothetical protein
MFGRAASRPLQKLEIDQTSRRDFRSIYKGASVGSFGTRVMRMKAICILQKLHDGDLDVAQAALLPFCPSGPVACPAQSRPSRPELAVQRCWPARAPVTPGFVRGFHPKARRPKVFGDPDPLSAGTAGEAARWGGSIAAMGVAANPSGAHQAGRVFTGRID